MSSSKKSTPPTPAAVVATTEVAAEDIKPTPPPATPKIPKYITTPNPDTKALTVEQEHTLFASAKLKSDKLTELCRINAAFTDDEQTRAVQVGVGLGGADVTGKWTPRTVAALVVWQRSVRFLPNGKIFPEQLEHFLNPKYLGVPPAAMPLPMITDCAAGLYDHMTEPGPNCGRWPVIDSQLETITSTDTWLSGMIRLVSGRKTSRMGGYHYSRGLDSLITLDTISIGIAHWWAGTIAKQIAKPLAERLPREVVDAAWGPEGFAILTDPERLDKILGDERGLRRYNPVRLDWFAAGWRAVARRPDAAAIQIGVWVKHYVGEALAVAREFNMDLGGRDGGLILAAVARMCNTGPASCREILRKYYHVDPKAKGAGLAALKDIFSIDREKGGYSKKGNGPRRWAILEATCRKVPSAALLAGRWDDAVQAELNLAATPTPARGYAPGGQD